MSGGFGPQAVCSDGIARRVLTLLLAATLLCLPGRGGLAVADTASGIEQSELRSHFLVIDLVGSAVRTEGNWDSGFGGAVGVGGLCGGCALAGWAASVGAMGFSERSGGQIYADLAAGTRWPTGVLMGISGGPLVELDELRRPRLGAAASIWLFAGVVPYARVGAVERGGPFLDVGLQIPLPAWRW